MTYKILHLADLHLDRPFREGVHGTVIASARREGLRAALKRAFEVARQRQVNAITIGGDLYEAEHVSQDTLQFLRGQFTAVAPLPIFIAPGNHDPFTLNAPYAYMDWPENVRIFAQARLSPLPLADGLNLWGAAHDSPACTKELLKGFRLPDRQQALLLMHGTDRALALGQQKHAFCPLSATDVRTAGFGLALLGHIHHARIWQDAKTILGYPGSPEPLGFDEQDGHSVIYAEWDGREWQTELVDISQWACVTADIDSSGLHSREDVVERIREFGADVRNGRRLVARVRLTGQPADSIDLDLESISAALAGDFAELQLVDETLAPFDLQALQLEQTTRGAFVRRMLERIESAEEADDGPQADKLKRALTYGLLALDGREIPNV